MDEKKKSQKQDKDKNKVIIDINDMGVNIDKNEYREIVQSQSNHPENMGWGRY